MVKHTPTPWEKEAHRPKVRNLRDELIADCGNFHIGSLEKRNANAAFIVEACNAHGRLKRERDALKEVANAVTVAYRVGAISGKLAKSTFELAEATLALCEEGGK